MKILIACEFSGIVRDAFKAKGHNVLSCDLEETERPGAHWKGDVLKIIGLGWDMMIAFPPCTYLTTTANRAFLNNPERWEKRLEAMKFVHRLINTNIGKICIENPKGVISSHIRKPDQYIQPYEHGHTDSKKTGLWLKNLPLLKPTNIVEPEWVTDSMGKKRYSKKAWTPGGGSKEERSKIRSKTYQGIANAMADQWG